MHERNLIDCKDAAENFGRTTQALGDRLGSGLTDLLREHGAAPILFDCPRMPRLEGATLGFSYIRWLGNRCEFLSGYTGHRKDRVEDLGWWSGLVDRFLEEGKTVFAYTNDHHQNRPPSRWSGSSR